MTEPSLSSITKAFLMLMLLALGMPAGAELSITRGSATTVASSTRETVPEWIYTLKRGESFAEVASDLLVTQHSPAQLLRYNAIANAAILGEGDRIRIPLSWLKRQPNPARVTSVSGSVQLISGIDGRKRTLTEEALIRVGDEVLSAAGAATITLADGSEVRLSPNSRLIFNRLTQYGKSGMVDTRLRLDRGEVHTRVKPVIEGGARFEIETPSAVAAVRGTAFSLHAGPEGTHLQVTEGVVDFGSPKQIQRIPAGYSATVASNNGNKLSIRKMPPAPELNPLPPVLSQLPAELTWTSSPASTYRLDIFETESGRWIESREVSGNRFDISRLDNGQYEIHLAAFDQQGMTGMPGILPIEVDLQARTAKLLAPENGGSVNDDMPEFRWELKGENEVARVEIAEDEAFRDLVATSEWAPGTTALPSRPLSPGQYYWRVVTEAGGNSVATTQPRKLVVNGTLPPVRIISINYIDSQVRVFWEKVDTAANYRMQLSEDPSFNDIIKEATLPDTTAALRLIPGRRYFVRLKALSDGPLESRWGPGRELYLE
ncbi:FecR domain-containing protein [Marinobacter sp. 1-4A]|uniref:FecR family protein n=1 Tax=unclassified Marinobacter TaxID=83889 RepID=UPI001907BFE3|nr:FecR domain-containing protein [Marinobacter sp. 1-4A]MBK1852398.1 FecR domain-containing protein [Marinobacter sp. 1-4A]